MDLFQRKIVGIDFHDYSAQLIELNLTSGKLFLEAYSRVLIPPSVIVNGEIKKEEELKELITALFQHANPHPILEKEIVVVFPSTLVFNHIFTFPANFTEDEIRKAIPFEAETVIPFAITDMYWDFIMLDAPPLEKGKPHSVLFSAIERKTADRYRGVLESMGLTPYFFGVEAESLHYALLKQTGNTKSSLIVDINTLSTNYLLIKNNVITDYFSSNEGGQYLVQMLSEKYQIQRESVIADIEKESLDEKYLPTITAFLEEKYRVAQKIIDANEKKHPGLVVDNIFLTGEFLDIPNYMETAKRFFPSKDIEVGDPRSNLTIRAENFTMPNAQKDISAQYYVFFVHSIGIVAKALLAKAHEGINLLPDQLKRNFHDKKIKLLAAFFAIGLTAVSLVVATLFMHRYILLNYERHSLEIQKASVTQVLYGTRYQEIRDQIVSFNKEVDELSTIDNSLFSVPLVLNKIQAIMPVGIKITGVTYADESLTVELNGVAHTREDLLKAHRDLQNAEFIEEVITPVSSYDEKYDASFSIRLKLKFTNLPRYGN